MKRASRNNDRVERQINLMNEQLAKNKMASLFKQVRIQSNIKQVDFAQKLGVTQGTVSKIESGIMAPDVFTYLKFSREFRVEVWQ